MRSSAARAGFIVLAVASASVVFPASSRASLIGDSVDCLMTPESLPGDPFWDCNPLSATVGAGVEFELTLLGVHMFDVDIASSSIVLTMVNANRLELKAGDFLTLSDLDWVGQPGEITGFTLSTAGTVTGLDDSDIFAGNDPTFGNLVDVFLDLTEWEPLASATIELQTSHDVPEAPTLLLLGAGCLLVSLRRRERRR